MGVKLCGNKIVDFSQLSKSSKINDEQRQGKRQFLDTEEEKKPSLSKDIEFISYDVSGEEIISNYVRSGIKTRNSQRSTIKDGHSRYEYKGARLDIYKRDEKYKSQFTYPDKFDKEEFIEKFPELESQPVVKASTKTSSIDSINGEIDETVSQGSMTGDCWLMTAVISMASTEKGKEIIKDSITVNDDDTVTVSFKGIGVSYTLTSAEISKRDTDSRTYDPYSNGDNDMLVLELATEKLWKDIRYGKAKLDTDDEILSYSGEGGGIDDGGMPSQMIYYLTGVEAKEYYYEDGRDIEEIYIKKILENALESNNTVMDIGIYDDVHSCKLTDGSTFSFDVGDGGHALSVVEITSDTVTFVNPWDSSTKYTATWSEFASLGIGYISSADLNEATQKETVDLTDNDTTSDYSAYEYGYDRYVPSYDYGYSYNYNYDYNYGYDYDYGYGYNDYSKYDNYEPTKPEFDYDKEYSYDNSSSYYKIIEYISELISEILEFFSSLYSGKNYY